jgi:hypothetical protein
VGGPACGALATLVCRLFFFSFSPLSAPSLTGGTPSCSQTLGGLPFASCCALLTNTRRDTTVSLFVLFPSFFYSHSLTDPPLTRIPPRPSCPCHVAPPTCCPVTSPPSRPCVAPRPFLTHCIAFLAHRVALSASSRIALLCCCDG